VRSGELDAANAIAVEKRIAGGPGTGAKEAVSTRNVPLMRRRIGIVFRALFLCGMQVSLVLLRQWFDEVVEIIGFFKNDSFLENHIISIRYSSL
jgi:hypothetical protein